MKIYFLGLSIIYLWVFLLYTDPHNSNLLYQGILFCIVIQLISILAARIFIAFSFIMRVMIILCLGNICIFMSLLLFELESIDIVLEMWTKLFIAIPMWTLFMLPVACITVYALSEKTLHIAEHVKLFFKAVIHPFIKGPIHRKVSLWLSIIYLSWLFIYQALLVCKASAIATIIMLSITPFLVVKVFPNFFFLAKVFFAQVLIDVVLKNILIFIIPFLFFDKQWFYEGLMWSLIIIPIFTFLILPASFFGIYGARETEEWE